MSLRNPDSRARTTDRPLPDRTRTRLWQAASFVLLLLLFAASLFVGSVSLPASEVCAALMGNADDTVRFIVLESRLPQALTALLAGSALAVSGLIMQTLFANSLADPSLLGVNSGASLGAAIALLLWGGGYAMGDATALSGVLLTMVAAFVGAGFVIALLLLASRYLRGNLALLVAGVMFSFGISAVISLLSFYATADGIRTFVVWGMGDFSAVPFERLPFLAVAVLLPAFGVLLHGRSLNALLLGQDYATNLGISAKRVRTRLLFLTGMLTAAVTSMCGPISFIGLAVPHIVRLIYRTADHKRLVPATLCWGGIVALVSLLLCHLPGEQGTLPLASVTPLLGVPVVFYILVRRR